MSTFNDHSDATERKYVLDEEQRFRAMARRNLNLGLWVAGRLGYTGEEAEVYARGVVQVDLQEAGEDDVFRKVRDDLTAAGMAASDSEIRLLMAELKAQALSDIAQA